MKLSPSETIALRGEPGPAWAEEGESISMQASRVGIVFAAFIAATQARRSGCRQGL
jgi:hypothetical protein